MQTVICDKIKGHLSYPKLQLYIFHRLTQFSQFNCSVVSDSLWPHGLQHARPPCPSPTPGACWNSCPSSQWCHPTISSSVIPFSSCPQSFPGSGSFPMSQFFTSGDQSNGGLLVIFYAYFKSIMILYTQFEVCLLHSSYLFI